MKLIEKVEDLEVWQSYFLHSEKNDFSWYIVKILEDKDEYFLVKEGDKEPVLIKKERLEDCIKIHLDGKEFQVVEPERLQEMLKKDKEVLMNMLKAGTLVFGGLLLSLLLRRK